MKTVYLDIGATHDGDATCSPATGRYWAEQYDGERRGDDADMLSEERLPGQARRNDR